MQYDVSFIGNIYLQWMTTSVNLWDMLYMNVILHSPKYIFLAFVVRTILMTAVVEPLVALFLAPYVF